MADTPHFAIPFRWDARTGHAAEVEQDSIDDIAACVEAVLRTRRGERDDSPAFGSPELVFRPVPVAFGDLVEAVLQWEPRADLLVEEAPDVLDRTLTRLRITVMG